MVHEWAVKMQTCRGFGGMFSRKNFKNFGFLDCLGLHFARFHVGEREKENVG